MALTLPVDLSDALYTVPSADSSLELGALLPGYAAYARVFNPAREFDVAITWASLARTSMRPDLQWYELQRIAPHANDMEPEMGTIDPGTALALVGFLRPRTSTPDQCVFLVWEGYARLAAQAATAPVVSVPPYARQMHVLVGDVEDALENLDEPPGERHPVWWLPADRAWSVCGDIYGRSVYVGATQDTIDALTRQPGLEAFRVPADYEVRGEDA